MSAHPLHREALSGLALLIFAVLLTATTVPAAAADRVNVMPDRQVRPGVSIPVWGNATDFGFLPGDSSADGDAYTWACSVNPDVDQFDDGTLTGAVADDHYIPETMSFGLLNGSTREQVTCTLTVDDGFGSVDSDDVQIDIVDGLPAPADSISDDELENLAVDANVAIADALRWLYLEQRPDGRLRWQPTSDTSPHDCGVTGFFVWAFANSGHTPLDDPDEDIYAEFVQRAIDWMLTSATTVAPVAQTHIGDPDADANGRMIAICAPITSDYAYTTPVAATGIMAAYSTAPFSVVPSGVYSGETYFQVVQDVIDHIAFAQDDSVGTDRGGWRYSPNSGADTSTDSWAYAAMEAFETAFGGSPLEAVKLEVERRLDASQDDSTPGNGDHGQFGYGTTSPLGFDGNATTAAGLSGLVMVTLGPRVPPLLDGGALATANYPDAQTRMDAAAAHLGLRWDAAPGTWAGNRGNFYAMWTSARALRLAEIETLVNGATTFDWETGEDQADPVSGGGSLPAPNATTEGYFPYLVRTQAADGRWAPTVNTANWTETINTTMGVLVLQQTVFGSGDPDSDGDGVPDSEDPFPDDPDITGSCALDLCAFADYIAAQDLSRFSGSSDGARARRRAVLKSRAQGACNAMQQCNEPIAIARLDSLIGLTDGLGTDYMVDSPNEITQRAADLKSVIEDGLCVDCP